MKHSLVTEIRELVYPEDRTRYDELVYRRDIYSTDRDRHRVSKCVNVQSILTVLFYIILYTNDLNAVEIYFFYVKKCKFKLL